jgi:hypothetical protein
VRDEFTRAPLKRIQPSVCWTRSQRLHAVHFNHCMLVHTAHTSLHTCSAPWRAATHGHDSAVTVTPSHRQLVCFCAHA